MLNKFCHQYLSSRRIIEDSDSQTVCDLCIYVYLSLSLSVLFLYVCMYICLYVCIYVCMHVSVYACLHVRFGIGFGISEIINSLFSRIPLHAQLMTQSLQLCVIDRHHRPVEVTAPSCASPSYLSSSSHSSLEP